MIVWYYLFLGGIVGFVVGGGLVASASDRKKLPPHEHRFSVHRTEVLPNRIERATSMFGLDAKKHPWMALWIARDLQPEDLDHTVMVHKICSCGEEDIELLHDR